MFCLQTLASLLVNTVIGSDVHIGPNNRLVTLTLTSTLTSVPRIPETPDGISRIFYREHCNVIMIPNTKKDKYRISSKYCTPSNYGTPSFLGPWNILHYKSLTLVVCIFLSKHHIMTFSRLVAH